jgi:hypothetical protein
MTNLRSILGEHTVIYIGLCLSESNNTASSMTLFIVYFFYYYFSDIIDGVQTTLFIVWRTVL